VLVPRPFSPTLFGLRCHGCIARQLGPVFSPFGFVLSWSGAGRVDCALIWILLISDQMSLSCGFAFRDKFFVGLIGGNPAFSLWFSKLVRIFVLLDLDLVSRYAIYFR
jgi:hypothetical protein